MWTVDRARLGRPTAKTAAALIPDVDILENRTFSGN